MKKIKVSIADSATFYCQSKTDNAIFSAQLELIQQLKLDLDLEPKEIYRSIKGRCSKDREFGNSAGAMINLVWEDRIDMKKNMPVSCRDSPIHFIPSPFQK